MGEQISPFLGKSDADWGCETSPWVGHPEQPRTSLKKARNNMRHERCEAVLNGGSIRY